MSSVPSTSSILTPEVVLYIHFDTYQQQRMGQRHNRRRTRLRSRNRNIVPVEPSTPPACFSDWAAPAISEPSSSAGQSPNCESACAASCEPIPTYPAPTWHHGYVAWRTREHRLEAEQYRLFGGEPGDDVSLCFRMLEYFGGLDYIDL